jgi:hypothetical protein
MTVAQKTEALSPKLLKVMERVKRDPEVRFTSLAHLIDEDALKRAYQRLRKNAAEGVGWHHQRTVRAETGLQCQRAASAAQDAAVSASARAQSAHPQGPEQDATDWHLVYRR